MNSNKVYVLLKGESHEGTSILGIFSSREKAENEGLIFLSRCRKKIPTPSTFPSDGCVWYSSVDYVEIQEWDVD